MEKIISLNSNYNSLDIVLDFLKESAYECQKVYDSWDVRTDSNGQMEQCITLKKSSMHGLKVHFIENSDLQLSYIIPNKVMNAYFGRSQKMYRSILEIIGESIKNLFLKRSQERAFTELEAVFNPIRDSKSKNNKINIEDEPFIVDSISG